MVALLMKAKLKKKGTSKDVGAKFRVYIVVNLIDPRLMLMMILQFMLWNSAR